MIIVSENINDYTNYDTFLLNDTIKNMGLAEATRKQYKYNMLMFLKCNRITLEDLVHQITNSQEDKINFETGSITKYNPNNNNSLIKQYYNNYINTLNNKGNKTSTIKARLQQINSILKNNDILIPNEITKKMKLENAHKKIPLLENKDIAYILNNHCNIHQKAIYTFMASTGIRRHDVFNFTINDFLKATSKFHNASTLDKFLNKIDNNFMVGYWKFKPHKTKKSGLECKTCNSSESTNYIIESLKQRKIAIDKYNENHNTNIKLTEEMPLFSNKRQHYIGRITDAGFTNITLEKNKIYQDYKMKSIKNDYRNGKITLAKYNDLKENIPIFKLHNLRHYFISVLRQYLNNRDISLIMEAHTSDIKTDRFYLGESSELFNEETIREAYNYVEKYLTFNKTISNDEMNKLKNYDTLKNENMKLHNTIIELKEKQNIFDEQMKSLDEFRQYLEQHSVLNRLEI